MPVKKKARKKSKWKVSEKVFGKLYSKLTRIRFEVGGKIYEVDLGDELLIREDIHSEVERISAILGYFGSIVAVVETEYRDADDRFKAREAMIDRRIRKQGMTGEARILAAIRRDPEWLEACLKVNKARNKMDRARNLLYALRKKADAVLARNADIRLNPNDVIIGLSKNSLGKARKEKSK